MVDSGGAGSAQARQFNRNAADPEQVKKAKTKEEILLARHRDDRRAVLGTPEGRRYIWALLSKCGLYVDVFRANSEMPYLAGQKKIGLEIMKDIIETDPKLWLLIQQEAYTEDEKTHAG